MEVFMAPILEHAHLVTTDNPVGTIFFYYNEIITTSGLIYTLAMSAFISWSVTPLTTFFTYYGMSNLISTAVYALWALDVLSLIYYAINMFLYYSGSDTQLVYA